MPNGSSKSHRTLKKAHGFICVSNTIENITVGVVGFPGVLAVALVLFGVADAQTPEDALTSKIASVRYPPLAETARIQGDVRLTVKSGAVTLLSGHALLASAAVENTKTFAPIQGATNAAVTYHFVIDTPFTSVPTSVTVKRGNAVERAVLWMFGRKTEKAATEYRCEEGTPPPSDVKIVDSVIEIWIHGREHCLETEAATIAARY